MSENWNPAGSGKFTPPPVFGRAGYTDRKFPDEVLARFETEALPEDAVVTHLTLAPYRGGRPVLARRDGRFWLPSGQVEEGEPVNEAIARIALEQTGILEPAATHLGHFRCQATVYSQNQAPGTITYRAFYAIQAGDLADMPSDPAYERRIVPQREMNALLRTHYAEFQREYLETLDFYYLELLKQSAGAGYPS